MLVLTRKRGERIVIRVPGRPDPIVVTVLDTYPDKVRIGAQASPDVRVHREELLAAKEAGRAEP